MVEVRAQRASRPSVSVAAVDLGASSGRVMLGEVGPGRLHLEPVARFANTPVRTPDGLHWDVLGLYAEALAGLRAAARLAATAGAGSLASVAVDSWAVDYGLLRDGRLLGTPYHYRDERRCTVGPEIVHAAVHAEDLQRAQRPAVPALQHDLPAGRRPLGPRRRPPAAGARPARPLADRP